MNKILAGILLSVATLAICFLMIFNKPRIEKTPPKPLVPKVEIMELRPQKERVPIKSNAIVLPEVKTTLSPLLNGTIIYVSDNFKRGKKVEKDELLIQIDETDYLAAVSSAKFELTNAEINLEAQKVEAELAQSQLKQEGRFDSASKFAKRIPQLNQAKAKYQMAKEALNQAEKNLQRTKIKAPYTGVILEQTAQIGDYAQIGKSLGQVYSTDTLEARVSLSQKEVGLLEHEYFKDPLKNPIEVQVIGNAYGKETTYSGILKELELALDPLSGSSYVRVVINDPLSYTPPLLPQTYVEVIIPGKVVDDLIALPSSAIYENKSIAILNKNNRIKLVPIKILSRFDAKVYLTAKVPQKAIVLKTLPKIIVENMEVSWKE